MSIAGAVTVLFILELPILVAVLVPDKTLYRRLYCNYSIVLLHQTSEDNEIFIATIYFSYIIIVKLLYNPTLFLSIYRANPKNLFDVFTTLTYSTTDSKDVRIDSIIPSTYDSQDILNQIPKFSYPCQFNRLVVCSGVKRSMCSE